MNAEELHDHLISTYFHLRVGMAVIALVFPIALWIGGYWYDIELQDSMSAYYHAGSGDFPMRNWFVGFLFAIGAFSYLYKGFSIKENLALNFAGVFAIGVAIFPMEWGCGNECQKFSIHGTFAVLFFACLIYVCLVCAKETLYLLKDEVLEKRYSRFYLALGTGMVASPVIAVILSFLTNKLGSIIFFVEAAGIWVFAIFWLVKSRELSISHAETHANDVPDL